MDFTDLHALAMERLNIAGQILETTYALVNEPKLFLSVIENIYGAFDISMDGMLQMHEISYDIGDHKKKIELFAGVHHNDEVTAFIKGLRNTIDNHNGASVEFIRHDQFIISDNDYNLIALSEANVRQALADAHKCMDALYN